MRLNEILASLLSLSFSLACPARYDKAANWVNRRVSTAQEFYNDMLPWQAAGALNTVFSNAGGIANTPQGLGHFGEGTGTFSADPTLLNAAGMFGDISLAAGAAGGTAGWARVGVTAVEETGAAMRYSRAGGASGDFMIPGEGALLAGLQDPALYGTRLTTTPTFNPALAEDGLTTGRGLNASVEIGPSAFSDRGNLVQTIIHEETHIRLDLRAAPGSQRAIGIQSTLSSEEAYAEAVAHRFWQRFGGR